MSMIIEREIKHLLLKARRIFSRTVNQFPTSQLISFPNYPTMLPHISIKNFIRFFMSPISLLYDWQLQRKMTKSKSHIVYLKRCFVSMYLLYFSLGAMLPFFQYYRVFYGRSQGQIRCYIHLTVIDKINALITTVVSTVYKTRLLRESNSGLPLQRRPC